MSQQSLKEALSKTVKGIQDNPVMSRVVFEAQTALVEDVRCTGQVRSFAPIVVDPQQTSFAIEGVAVGVIRPSRSL